MNDAMLVCICRMSARAYASSAVRWHVMLHFIHYPIHKTSVFSHKLLMPLPFD